MRKYIFGVLFILLANTAGAQCLTNSLIINTRYNPISNAAITPGTNGGTPVTDPHWVLTAVSPAVATAIAATPITGLVAVTPGSSADVVQTLTGNWISAPAGNPGGWISCLNSNTYNDQGTGQPYTMTLGRVFRLCSADSIKIVFNIASDNLVTAADVDGTPLPWSGTGFSTFTLFTKTVYLTAGTHTINIQVTNQNLTTVGANPTGLDVYGTVSSTTGANSLVSESYASCAAYTCGASCNTVTTPDSLHLCQYMSDSLRATLVGTDSVLSIAWTPTTGLSSPAALHTGITVGATSGYYDITVQSLTPFSLVNNGDFSQGNTGFSSTYMYVSGPNSVYPEATYAITTNPINVHNLAIPFGDHTTGTGNMMVINGASAPTSVWCQTIPVTPNTDYAFSAWVANWSTADVGPAAPLLQFQINGVLIGVPDNITAAPGVWVKFYAVWNSGSNTTASICIYDEVTAASGNDFALDDISFQKICTSTDSIYVDVSHIDTTYAHASKDACANIPAITLTAPTGHNSYLWSNGSNASSISVGTSGNYWVYATSACAMLIDTFHVAFRPLPAPPVADKNLFYCKGFTAPPLDSDMVANTDSVLWYYNGTLINGAQPAPTNLVTYPNGTNYYVSQIINGCQSDSTPVNIKVIDTLAFTITTTSPWVCLHDSLTISYSGNKLIDSNYLWTLPTGASLGTNSFNTDSSIIVKFDSVNGDNITLMASNLHGECFGTQNAKIDVIPLPVATALTKGDVCLHDTVSLSISYRSVGAIDYVWAVDNDALNISPAVSIIASNSNDGGPFTISWNDTGRHLVYIQPFAIHGCTSPATADTVNVHALPDATFKINTLTGPLCLQDSVLFTANDENFADAYEWAPARYFREANKHIEWGRLEQEHSIVTLTVTDPYGCAATASKELDPSVCCNIVFPTAFTPNGDRINNVFRPIQTRAFHVYHEFRIVNRWGQTIFESTNNKAEWDGTFNGVPQELGVYYYYLKYDCDGKTVEQKGDITLVR